MKVKNAPPNCLVKKRTSELSGKKTHPVLTEKLTLDRANIIFL